MDVKLNLTYENLQWVTSIVTGLALCRIITTATHLAHPSTEKTNNYPLYYLEISVAFLWAIYQWAFMPDFCKFLNNNLQKTLTLIMFCVPPISVEILCKDVENNKKIDIENQFHTAKK